MTLAAAYALLEARWPGRSFCISLEVWKHGAGTTVEWQVFDLKDGLTHTGPTLEVVMELALGCDADLAALDQQVADFPGTEAEA
jgi:hypothetical protein